MHTITPPERNKNAKTTPLKKQKDMIFRSVIIFLLFAGPVLANEIPQEVQNIVISVMQGGRLKGLLEKNFNEFWKPGNFPKLSDLSTGEPFPVYVIDDSTFIKADIHAPMSTLIKKTDKWVVPILNKNKIALRFEIYKKDGKWVEGKMGGSLFAMGWQKVIDEYNTLKGYNTLYITIGCGGMPYFSIPEVDDYNLTKVLLVNDGKGGTLSKNAKKVYSHLTPSSETISKIKELLKLNK